MSPSARLASRLRAFATNRHESCGLASGPEPLAKTLAIAVEAFVN